MTRPRLAILPQQRAFNCRRCDVEVVYLTAKQPPPGAAYRLCRDCEVATITGKADPDVLTDETADVRGWRAPASIVDELLDAPLFVPDLEF